MRHPLLPSPRRWRTALQAVLLGLGSLALGSAWAAGSVQVDWQQPDRYADAGRSVVDRERTLAALGEHIQRLGTQLPEGQRLQIEVTDLNLAGEIHPWGWHELRILRGRADWPKMSLRYTLSDATGIVRQGQSELADMGYFFRTQPGALGYEKRMIDRWFRETILAR